MGGLLRFLGVVALLVGISGTVYSFAGPFLNLPGTIANPIADVMNAVEEGPKAEDLCEEGEHIVQIDGAESYTPGLGYGREMTVFCEDAEGNRRDVTEQFAGDMIGQALGSVTGVLGSVGVGFCFSSLIIVGVVLLLIGSLVSRRRQPVMVGGMPGVQVMNMPLGQTGYSRGAPVGPGDLTTKLRQLEEARNKNLISEDEYERMRKSILDSMS